MRRLTRYILLCFWVTFGVARAQYMDTLKVAFRGKKTLDIGFDTRNSFVDNTRMSVQSIKLGVLFGRKISMGIGYAWLNRRTPVFDRTSYYDPDLNKDTFITRRLTFSYFRFYVNYVYYKSRRWEFSIPLQAGIGKLGFKYTYNGIDRKIDEGYCFLYEPEVDVKFRVNSWLGLEGDVGYRFLFKGNKFIEKTFNSPVISLGIFIVWNEAALRTFPKSEWVQKKFGPSEW